jgi:hypothetical protein
MHTYVPIREKCKLTWYIINITFCQGGPGCLDRVKKFAKIFQHFGILQLAVRHYVGVRLQKRSDQCAQISMLEAQISMLEASVSHKQGTFILPGTALTEFSLLCTYIGYDVKVSRIYCKQ